MSALAVERLLDGSQLERKPAARDLLSGLGGKLLRASDLAPPASAREPLVTGVSALDSLLSGGLARGAFVELSGRRSCGRFSIGIASLAAATSAGESAALVDLGGHLDPQSAEASGVELARLLWVRPSKLKEAVASTELLLSAGFPLVVVDLGLPPVRGLGCRRPADGVSYCRGDTSVLADGVAYGRGFGYRRPSVGVPYGRGFAYGSRVGGRLAVGGWTVPDAAWVRLSRAARDRRAVLLLLAPYRVSGIAAQAVVSADAARALWRGEGRSPRLLSGIATRLTLTKDARARSLSAEDLRLEVA